MGFNNKGVEHLTRRIKGRAYTGVLGVNIGKNFDTPNEKAADDYKKCLKHVYPYADYVAVNVSSPNTRGLRELQNEKELEKLLSCLIKKREELILEEKRKVPLLLKIAPDLDDAQIPAIAELLIRLKIDGVIAANTTIDHDSVRDFKNGQEQGGLSGAPLSKRAVSVVRMLRESLPAEFPIIGVGGIMSAEDAQKMLAAGATLIQVLHWINLPRSCTCRRDYSVYRWLNPARCRPRLITLALWKLMAIRYCHQLLTENYFR